MKICGIYCLKNLVDGSVYVGQSQDIENRWAGYRALHCKDQKKLYRALKKYGVDNFEFVILEECTLSELYETEKFWIAYLDSVRSGYNISWGGESCMRGLKHSEETRKKMSEAKRGKKHSEEARRKISEVRMGKKMSEETRRKISEAMRGKKRGPFSEEARKKIGDAMRGKKRGPFSEETRKKIGDAKMAFLLSEQQPSIYLRC